MADSNHLPVIQPEASILDELNRSKRLFLGLVWPLVVRVFGPGRLVPVEGTDVAWTRVLDYAGIDYLYQPAGRREPFGLSSRVQRCRRTGESWDSFTLSAHQYHRLQGAIRQPCGQLLPALLIQAYVTDQPAIVASVGIARTVDVLSKAPDGSHTGSGGLFHSWSFDSVAGAGALLIRIPEPRAVTPFAPGAAVS